MKEKEKKMKAESRSLLSVSCLGVYVFCTLTERLHLAVEVDILLEKLFTLHGF